MREGPPRGAPLGPRALSSMPTTRPGPSSSSSLRPQSQVEALGGNNNNRGQATPEVATGKGSVKHLTCHFWRTSGTCKKGASCGYAHWDTGKYAQVPVRLYPNAPALAGRNLEAEAARLRRDAAGAMAARQGAVTGGRQGRVEEDRERQRQPVPMAPGPVVANRQPQGQGLGAQRVWRPAAVTRSVLGERGVGGAGVGVGASQVSMKEPGLEDYPETVQGVLRSMDPEICRDFTRRG